MKISEKYKALLGNTGLLFVGTFGCKMISFIMLPFYTTWLSIEDFGTSDLINAYSSVLLSIISLCIGDAVFVIPTGRSEHDQKQFFSTSLVFAFVCSLVLLLLYWVIGSVRNCDSSSFEDNIGYITLLCGSTIYVTIAQQFCKCINRIKVFAYAGVVNTLSVAILGFVLIRSYGLFGYVLSLIIANLIALVYIFTSARLITFVSIKAVSKRYLLELLKYSIPLIPNSITWLIVSYLNRPIMEASIGLSAIGLFSLANRFPTLISSVYANFSNSWQISVLQEFGKEEYCLFYNRVCLVTFVLMCLGVSIITVIVGPIIHLFFNESYYAVVDYIPWLCFSTPFMSLASVVGANFSAIRQSKYFFYSSIGSAFSAIIFNSLLIPVIGIWGACISTIISFVISALLRIFYARNIVQLKWKWMYILFVALTIMILIIQQCNFHLFIFASIVLIEIIACITIMLRILGKNVTRRFIRI